MLTKSIPALLIVLIAFILPLDLNPAHRQVQDLKLQHEAIAINIEAVYDYLLYYSPKDYQTDGKFRNIKVRVKGKSYRVNYRAGYIAD